MQFSAVRTPNEFEALSVLPIRWASIVLAKNLATMIITVACLPMICIPVLYFSTDTVPAGHFIKAGLYFVSVIFPLLHAGNLQSLLHPRRHGVAHRPGRRGALGHHLRHYRLHRGADVPQAPAVY